MNIEKNCILEANKGSFGYYSQQYWELWTICYTTSLTIICTQLQKKICYVGGKFYVFFDHIDNNVTRSKNNTPLLISSFAINTDKDNYPSD